MKPTNVQSIKRWVRNTRSLGSRVDVFSTKLTNRGWLDRWKFLDEDETR